MYCRNCGTEHPDTAQFCPNCGVGTAAGGMAVSTEYAGFWRRVGAYLLDALILAIPNIILTRIGGAGSLAVIVVDWIYFAYQESSPAQATLGKRALGIKVTGTDGDPISFGRATGRYYAKVLSFLIVLIRVIMVAFTPKKQGLHDMIASTLVVKSK
jgi:uncharacterized RDD family membrane protein YckC